VIDKEDTSRTIFGIGREDGCVLNSLTEAQQKSILDALDLTDELDVAYDQRNNSASFVAAFSKAREKYADVSAMLPTKDIRAVLLGTTLEAYENLVTLIIGTELNLFHGDTTPTVASARMRKLFLRKIISGELDTDGQAFLDYLLGREVIQKTNSSSHTKIPLPSVSKTPGAKAHSFPVQVSIQTQEFIQAVLFYAMFADIAAGNYVRLPNALNNIEQELSKEGLDKKLWDSGWSYLQRYQPIFNNTIFQNVLILMRSHWDWYIRQIGEFVSFARNHVSSPALDRNQQKDLARVGWKEITQQLRILEESCGIKFSLSQAVLSDINEMSLVRNLGMHNRWEVDDYYLNKTSSSNWDLKDVRLIEIAELRSWSGSLSKLINETSLQLAMKYAGAPDFR
jgi:hypothetical protein